MKLLVHLYLECVLNHQCFLSSMELLWFLNTAPQNEVAGDKHQQLFDDSFHQQFSDEELCTEDTNNLIVTIILAFELVGISPDIILTKLKNLKLEVHEPCGLRHFISHMETGRRWLLVNKTKQKHGLGTKPANQRFSFFALFIIFIYFSSLIISFFLFLPHFGVAGS